ncbi:MULTISPECIES: hypothetical protein [Streptomyces]|uniref:Uncharacterized protein n=2 Tax=Streptomyces TaxID=1883 RepID=A0A100Y2C0_9ACTN|nr:MULTISPECIES: hypothetical protein [Streptomyces]KUH36401.1 hypothetical protein ATE80_23805 [Streptomyces kanasensis]UUS35099.1 hypothetical protein NRO40_30300 [Streptomyces changanensis]
MRPVRFTEFVVTTVRPRAARVQTLAEACDTRHPFGVGITLGVGGEARWQFTGQLPEGAKHDSFTDEAGAGTPAPAGPSLVRERRAGAWIAAVAGAQCPEVAAIERWSTRPNTASATKGLTLTFHNGARIFARLL